MKKTLFARGISALSLVGAISAMGCSADTWDEGAAGEGEIGSVAQAATLATPLAGADVAFAGMARLGTTNKWISIGGYNSINAAVNHSVIIDPSLTGAARYQALSAAIPAALGEVSIKQIDHVTTGTEKYVFAVAGGRTAFDAAAVKNSYILELSGTDFQTANWITLGAGAELRTAAVLGHDEIKQCGNASQRKFLAAGGMTDNGMLDRVAMTATDAIQVFTYVPGSPSSGSWANLVDNTTPTPNTVKLFDSRGYKETLDIVDGNNEVHDIRVFGGANAGETLALATVEKILVDDNCVADGNLQAGSGVRLIDDTMNDLPTARARMDSIKKNVTINNVTYEFIIAGGNTSGALTAPTDVFYYDANNDAYDDTTADLAVGRLFPLFANDNNQVQLVAGVMPDNNAGRLFDDTTNEVDILSAANGTRSNGADLAEDRVGHTIRDVIGGTGFTANGRVYTNGVVSAPATVTNVESF